MSNGRDFYTTRSYLDYIPSYHDIQTNLDLYISHHPETVYHFSCGLVCYCITKTKSAWYIRSRGLFNPRGIFQTVYKTKDFLICLKKFQEIVSDSLFQSLEKYNNEVPF